MTNELPLKFHEMCSIEKQYSGKHNCTLNPMKKQETLKTKRHSNSSHSSSSSTASFSSFSSFSSFGSGLLRRFSFRKRSHSKEGLDEKTPDQPNSEKPKSKSKFLGLFHSSSDPELHSKSKPRKSFLRRKKNDGNESKESQDEASSAIFNNRIEGLPDDLLPDSPLPVQSSTEKPLMDESFLANSSPDNVFTENKLTDNSFSENASHEHSLMNENSPFNTSKSTPVSTMNSTSQKHAIEINPFPNDKAWKRAQEVWEKNETEETKEKEKEKRRKKGKREHDRKREGKDRDGKTRTRSKSREKDKEHAGKERSESKSRSKEKKKRTKDEYEESKKEERRGKDDMHKKYKSKSERHSGHKRESFENLKRYGYESDSDLDYRHENKTDHKHKHDHRRRYDLENAHDRTRDYSLERPLESTRDRYHDSPYDHERTHYHSNDRSNDHTYDRARAKEHKHYDHQKYKSEKHSKNQEYQKQKEPKNRSPYSDDKKIELDKVWREYKSGKRYHSQEKDMKKIIDRLDGVERFRREERLRSSDKSHDRSSDTSYEVARRSRSRERRRRSRSREKHKHESDQDSNHSSAWQYSLSRIEARQEQCTADIDTARRSIEHRIKKLEMRFEKQYSSSERIPEKSPEKSNIGKPHNSKKIIDQVADECREVTRTLEVRTEEMNSEIASVVREDLSHLDEKLNNQHSRASSSGPFSDMRVVENFRCEEMTMDPIKDSRYDNKLKLDAGVTSVEHRSSADKSGVTVTDEESLAQNLSKEEVPTDSVSLSSSRDSPIRVSQSGALDTLNEPIGQKNSVSSTCDSGISADNQSSPIHLRSPGTDNLHELSLESFEEDVQYGGSNEKAEGSDCTRTQESLQMEYRRKIKETEARFQERVLVEKEILYKRINELESMLLAKRESKGQYA